MTLSGLFFLIFGFEAAAFISIRRLLGSRALPLLLFGYHLGFALFYWNNSLGKPADSHRYYNNAAGPELIFKVGTGFIDWLVQRIQWVFHGSYLDLFLLFHITGFLGLCFLYRTLMETFPVHVSTRVKKVMCVMFFLPGMHFWTTAIGKDSLIFLGINIVIWSTISPRRRLAVLFGGFVLIFFIRPHIAGIIILAIGLALLWRRGVPLLWKVALSLLVAAFFAIILPSIVDYVGLMEVDAESVGDYFQQRQGYNQEGRSGVDIGNYPYLLKLFTYFYRPLFFDASNALDVLVSVENMVWLLFSVILVSILFLNILWKHPNGFFIWFNLFYFSLYIGIFALTASNLGVAIRQKTMVLPSLAVLIMTTYAVKRYLVDNRKVGRMITAHEAISGAVP